jgi:hypothetical protein
MSTNQLHDYPSIKHLTFPLPEGLEETNDWYMILCPNIYSDRVVILTEVNCSFLSTMYSIRYEDSQDHDVYQSRKKAFVEFVKYVTTP